MNENMLMQYARLVAGVGIHVQKGQTVVVRCPVDCAAFGRMLNKACFELGAKDVVMEWRDDFCNREHYLHADDSVFDAVYSWNVQKNTELGKMGAGFITVSASDPENLRGVDPDRLRRWKEADGRDLKDFYRDMFANGFPWCVVSVPVLSWAKKVFPNDTDDAAMEKLWDAIFAAVRVREDGDAVQAWREHCAYLDEYAAKLNALKLTQLRYQNALGTDVTVGMPKEHLWLAGADTAKSGVRFVANMPTEEIFSAPQRDAVDGVLCASKPLALDGNLIEGIRLTLEHGRIVGIHADKGEDVLRQAIESDEGAHYLGEIALVPVNSPIAQSGLLYYNTLFDENGVPLCVRSGLSGVRAGRRRPERRRTACLRNQRFEQRACGFHGRHGGFVHHRYDERRARGRNLQRGSFCAVTENGRKHEERIRVLSAGRAQYSDHISKGNLEAVYPRRQAV